MPSKRSRKSRVKPIHHGFDFFSKRYLRYFLKLLGKCNSQQEIRSPSLFLDLVYVPYEGVEKGPMGLGVLEQIAKKGASAIEIYHDTPNAEEWLDCITKRNIWHQTRRKVLKKQKKEAQLPYLWVLSAGKPEQIIQSYQLVPMPGWPTGFYTGLEVCRLSLVVLRELPPTDETMILRLLGGGKSFRGAVEDLKARPVEDPLYQQLLPILVAFHPELRHIFREESDIMQSVETLYKRWEQRTLKKGWEEGVGEGIEKGIEDGLEKGRAGMQRTLLLILQSRNIAYSPEALQKIQGCKELAILEQWLARAIDAPSIEQIFQDGGA